MTRQAIEAALRRDPTDEQAWTVFGDLLADAGDERGELIALDQRAGASERPFERALLEHQAGELFDRGHRGWLGPLADAGLEIVWQRGFAREVVIARAHVATLRTLLELPTSALLHKLVLVRPRGLASLVELLGAHRHDRPLASLEVRGVGTAGEPAASLAPLAKLTTLTELTVEGCDLAELELLADLPSLRRLNLRRCRGPLTGLAEFSSRRGDPAELAPIEALAVAAHAEVGSLGREPLAPLATLVALRELDLGDAGWSDVEPLAGLVALERLDLRSTEVLSLAPLRGMTELRELDCSGCTALTNLDPLAALTKLRNLRLSYTRVRDLRPLAGLEQLERLDLAGSPVVELSPLFGLPKLHKLDLKACEVHDVGPLLRRGVTIHGVRPPQRSWRDLAEDLLRGS